MPLAAAGALTVRVAVGAAQVGWVVTEAVGAVRVPVGALTITAVWAEVHPLAFLYVTW